ncbi:MAG TPA: FecR domain-containing protein [Cytophagaceae bacterium]|jgi:ferric-dicitrate binding protein FerR (iron transport regulator)
MAGDIKTQLKRYFAGEANMEETKHVLLWLSSVKDERMVKEMMKSDWDEIMNNNETLLAGSPELWDSIKLHLKDGKSSPSPARGRFIEQGSQGFVWSTFFKIAAILLVFVGLAYVMSQWDQQGRTKREDIITRTAPDNAKIKFALVDGSTIYLNKGSKLTYYKDLSPRDVTLEGEAFFEIAKDPKHPFQVHVADITVKVLGTHFNISSYASKPNIVVFLSEGSVTIKEKTREYRLKPGEIAVYQKKDSHMQIEKANGDSSIAWTGRKLIFHNDPLPIVLKKLETRYGVHTRIQGLVDKNCLFNAVIENDSLNTVLEMIKLTSNSNYTVKGDSVILYPGRCK